MGKKTRMSAVIDNSTMGLSLGTEMEITRSTHKSLRKAFCKAAQNGVDDYNVAVTLVSGHKTEGNATYQISFVEKTGAENSILYECKKQGSNYFINVSGNPTVMVAGANDIPILIKGFAYGEYNAPTITFKYLNRVMYAVLDDLFAPFGFRWEGADKKRLVNGDISIQRYQVAWYSGDLGPHRTPLMLYLRTIYCGLDATKEKVHNVVAAIGLNGRAWNNNEGNLTIEAKSGKLNKYFSLTMYAKDQDPKYSAVETDRVANLIRWDCTLFNTFLHNNKIKKIADLEAKYIEQCDKEGYDIGFIRFVASKIQSQLKMAYLIGLNVETYKKMLKELNSIRGKNECTLRDYWLEYGRGFETAAELAKHLGMKESTLSETKKSLMKQTNLDIEIPRSTHEAVLDNRERGTMSEEERGEWLLDIKGTSNRALRRHETVERDRANSETFTKLLKNADVQGALRIRKFKPIKVTPEKFWILNSPPLPVAS